MTLKEKYEKEVEAQKNDAEVIKSATDYTSTYLKFGSSCDSSERSSKRMKYIKKAEEVYIKKHKKEIIELAAEICLSDIG